MALFEVKTKGQKRVWDRIKKILKTPSYSVQIHCNPTISTYYKSIPGTSREQRQTEAKQVARSATQNAVIVKAQAKRGRNVAYLTKKERNSLDKKLGDAIHVINSKLSTKKLEETTKVIGDTVAKHYKEHIVKNKGPRTRLKPNTRATFFSKIAGQSKGAIDNSLRTKLTPMIETGALSNSFRYRVQKRG